MHKHIYILISEHQYILIHTMLYEKANIIYIGHNYAYFSSIQNERGIKVEYLKPMSGIRN